MMFSSAKEILENALRGKYAVGAFNVSNMEIVQAVVMAAAEKKAPLVIQITESAMKYAGAKEITEIAKIVVQERSEGVPIALNLDHGKTFESAKKAIDMGFSAVMIDGSRLTDDENKVLTKRVVQYAHPKKITVQAELGIVPYLGETDIADWGKLMTDPDKAEKFVKYTKVDSLAVAIGNAHGFFREPENYDWERLKEIRRRLSIPLVLHGASDWSRENAAEAVRFGISCFNVDTDIRLTFMHELCKNTSDKCSTTDPRKIMDQVRTAIKNKVIEKISMYGSANRA